MYILDVLLLKEFGVCINEPETTEIFESGWKKILDKYDLDENLWLQSLYRVRQRWFLCTSKMFLLLNFQQLRDLKA
jgi:hypothetical protein